MVVRPLAALVAPAGWRAVGGEPRPDHVGCRCADRAPAPSACLRGRWLGRQPQRALPRAAWPQPRGGSAALQGSGTSGAGRQLQAVCADLICMAMRMCTHLVACNTIVTLETERRAPLPPPAGLVPAVHLRRGPPQRTARPRPAGRSDAPQAVHDACRRPGAARQPARPAGAAGVGVAGPTLWHPGHAQCSLAGTGAQRMHALCLRAHALGIRAISLGIVQYLVLATHAVAFRHEW